MSGGEFNEAFPEEDEEPTIDDLAVDTSLPPVERIARYVYSDIVLQRIFAVKDIPATAQEVGYERTNKELLPLVDEILTDPEPAVRQELIEQLPHLAKHLVEAGKDAGYKNFKEHILPVMPEATTDPNAQVRAAATEALPALAELLKKPDIVDFLVPLLAGLAGDAVEEEHRVAAAVVLNGTADTVGKDLVVKHCLPLVNTLAKDKLFRVRKAVAAHLGSLAKVLGPKDAAALILPLAQTLAKDEIWGVRKALTESLVDLASALSPADRSKVVRELIEALVKDSSRWVRSSAMQVLGQYIATLKADQVSDGLLTLFADMSKGTNGSVTDSDVAAFCAFNFPAVVLTCGKNKWPALLPAYTSLTQAVQWKVRRTLAYSLHHIAKVIGPGPSASDLGPVFELFRADLDEVKSGVVANVATFLSVLNAKDREPFLTALTELGDEKDNWRFRQMLGEQMETLVTLFPPDTVAATFAPLVDNMLHDKVIDVRLAALKAVPALLARLSSAKGNTQKDFVAMLSKLGDSKSYKDRQTFVAVTAHLLGRSEGAGYTASFVPLLAKLSGDRVPNVRIAVARAFVGADFAKSKAAKDPAIKSALQTLTLDKDKNVLELVSPAKVPNPLTLNGPLVEPFITGLLSPKVPAPPVPTPPE